MTRWATSVLIAAMPLAVLVEWWAFWRLWRWIVVAAWQYMNGVILKS